MKTEPQKVYELKLTPAQKEEIRELSGKEAETLVFTVEELEERITPRLATN